MPRVPSSTNEHDVGKVESHAEVIGETDVPIISSSSSMATDRTVAVDGVDDRNNKDAKHSSSAQGRRTMLTVNQQPLPQHPQERHPAATAAAAAGAIAPTGGLSSWAQEGYRRVRSDQVQRKMHWLTGMAAIGGFLFGYDT